MDLSSSIFDYDFGTGFDDFVVGALDDYGADFQRAFDFDFGTAFDAAYRD
jgi:hypothetical protein